MKAVPRLVVTKVRLHQRTVAAVQTGLGRLLAPVLRNVRLVATLLDPRAGTVTSFNVIVSLSAVIGFHLHRPTVIPKVARVSVMLAERGTFLVSIRRGPNGAFVDFPSLTCCAV